MIKQKKKENLHRILNHTKILSWHFVHVQLAEIEAFDKKKIKMIFVLYYLITL